MATHFLKVNDDVFINLEYVRLVEFDTEQKIVRVHWSSGGVKTYSAEEAQRIIGYMNNRIRH